MNANANNSRVFSFNETRMGNELPICVIYFLFIFNVASLRKSERLISSRGHGCFTINPLQLSQLPDFPHMALATRARVTDSDQTVQRGIRTSAVLRPLVYESVVLTIRPRALLRCPRYLGWNKSSYCRIDKI